LKTALNYPLTVFNAELFQTHCALSAEHLNHLYYEHVKTWIQVMVGVR